MKDYLKTNEHFEQGLEDALKRAQEQANKEGRSIRVPGGWVNPSSASLARRPKQEVKNEKPTL
jgi:hypothetical protein